MGETHPAGLYADNPLHIQYHLNSLALLHVHTHIDTSSMQVFQPYAKYWLPCLISLILRTRDRGEGMQYFIVDVVVTLLSWASTAIPEVRSVLYF